MKNVTEGAIGCGLVLLLSGAGVAATIGAMIRTPAGFLALLGATVFVLSLVVGAAAVVGLWVWNWKQRADLEQRRAAEFIAPDDQGRLPVPVDTLRDPQFAYSVLDTYKASYMQNVTTYHNRPTSSITGADAETMQIATQAPQTFAQLYHSGQLPDNGFLMGYDMATNEPVIADWRKLYSALIGGQSGSGKSTLIRSILAQAALQGGRFVVLDKHYGAGEESLGASLKPLQGRMMCGIAYDDATMIDALKLVQSIGDRRLAGQDKDKTPIVLVVDETTALLLRSNVAELLSDVLGQISQETRKVGLYAMCIGQNFSGEVMPTIVRNSFVSFLCTKSRRDVARVMTSNPDFAKLAADLTIGQAVWMTPAGEVVRLSVPNCTAADLELVAGTGFRVVDGNDAATTGKRLFPTVSKVFPEPTESAAFDDDGKALGNGSETPGKPSEAADARVERVRQMIKAGHNSPAIIKAIWGDVKGRAYQSAQDELTAIIASLI